MVLYSKTGDLSWCWLNLIYWRIKRSCVLIRNCLCNGATHELLGMGIENCADLWNGLGDKETSAFQSVPTYLQSTVFRFFVLICLLWERCVRKCVQRQYDYSTPLVQGYSSWHLLDVRVRIMSFYSMIIFMMSTDSSVNLAQAVQPDRYWIDMDHSDRHPKNHCYLNVHAVLQHSRRYMHAYVVLNLILSSHAPVMQLQCCQRDVWIVGGWTSVGGWSPKQKVNL